jgi:hypothetical protein
LYTNKNSKIELYKFFRLQVIWTYSQF